MAAALGFAEAAIIAFGCQKSGATLATSSGGLLSSGDDAIENGVSDLDGIRADLLEFLVTLRAEDFVHGGVMVEAGEGRAQRGHVEDGAFAAFHDLRNKHRLGLGVLFAGFLHFLEKSLEFDDVSRDARGRRWYARSGIRQ